MQRNSTRQFRATARQLVFTRAAAETEAKSSGESKEEDETYEVIGLFKQLRVHELINNDQLPIWKVHPAGIYSEASWDKIW